MKMENVTSIYFSPTEGTKGYVNRIAESFSKSYIQIDIADVETRKKEFSFSENDLVIIGVPVYYGRIPQVVDLFSKLKANNTPTILVLTYGNREFDDALLELNDSCIKSGFKPIGASTFIAPHTFSHKIGKGRPNAQDMAELDVFTTKMKELILSGNINDKKLSVPGNFPYKEFQPAPFFPTATDDCTNCGACAKICPVCAIDFDNPKETDGEKCLRCLACIKVCPNKSRRVLQPAYQMVVEKLEGLLINNVRTPSFYYTK